MVSGHVQASLESLTISPKMVLKGWTVAVVEAVFRSFTEVKAQYFVKTLHYNKAPVVSGFKIDIAASNVVDLRFKVA